MLKKPIKLEHGLKNYLIREKMQLKKQEKIFRWL